MRGIVLICMVTIYDLLINNAFSTFAYIQLTCTKHVTKMAETYSSVLQRNRRHCLYVNAAVMYLHQKHFNRPHWRISPNFQAFSFVLSGLNLDGIISWQLVTLDLMVVKSILCFTEGNNVIVLFAMLNWVYMLNNSFPAMLSYSFPSWWRHKKIVPCGTCHLVFINLTLWNRSKFLCCPDTHL